eukprot:6867239-Pyramimonas_sp.AAC.1
MSAPPMAISTYASPPGVKMPAHHGGATAKQSTSLSCQSRLPPPLQRMRMKSLGCAPSCASGRTAAATASPREACEPAPPQPARKLR